MLKGLQALWLVFPQVCRGTMSKHQTPHRMLLAVLVACLTGAGAAHARPLTDELAHLLDTHPQIREARDNYRSAVANQDNAFASFLPQASLTADKGFEHIDSPARRANQGDASRLSNEQATLTVTTPIFTGFRNESAYSTAKTDVEIARQTMDLTVQTLIVGALSSYVQTKRSVDTLALAEQSIQVIEEQVALQQEQVDRGTGIQLDLLLAQTALQDAKAVRAVIQSELANAAAQYVQFFGTEPDITTMSLLSIPEVMLPQTLNEAVEIAVDNNVGLDIAGQQIDRAIEQIRSAQSTYYPDLNLVTALNWENNLDATRGIQRDFSVILRSTWQIFDGFGTEARTNSARHQAAAARNRNRFTHRQVSQDTRIAWAQYEATLEQESLFLEAAILAQEVVAAQEELQESGRETAIALLQAEVAALDRERALVAIRSDRTIAAFQLLFSMGRLNPAVFGLPSVDADQVGREDAAGGDAAK